MKRRILSAILLITLLFALTMLLSSCNASNADGGNYMPGAPDKGEMNSGSSDSGGGIGSLPSGGVDNPSAKIIKIADATVKTLDYDTFIDELYAKITEYKGYTDGESFRGSAPTRTATVTVRIPADSLDAFKTALSGMGTMTYYNADKIDVSLQYATLSARIETLEVEIGVVEDLFEIAKNEGNLDRIYTLEQRLTALKLDLAESRAEIAVYDNSIAYSTVNLTVKEYEEVVEEEPEPEEEKGAFVRIGENLARNFKDIGNFFVELFVFLISATPYLLLIGGIVTGIIFLIKAIKRRKRD